MKEIILVFLKLGVIAFGGPAAHIAMMEEEVVNRRAWMNREYFLDLIGITNLIPGPNSTEMAIHCGMVRAGWKGLIVAGMSFILPATVLTTIFAYFYVEYGELPQVEPFLAGIRPTMLVIIVGAVLRLGKTALKGRKLGVIGFCVFCGALYQVSPVVLLLGAGFIGMISLNFKNFKGHGKSFSSALPLVGFPYKTIPILTTMMADVTIANSKIFFVFLKVGSVLFGSGYLLIAYLEGELIQKLGWLSQVQLLDAIAIGQITPGPVLTTATVVGYQLAGIGGAVMATLGIFLPSFLFVALLKPVIPKLRSSIWSAAFLDSVNISAVALMLAVTIKLGHHTLVDWRSFVIVGISLVIVFYVKKVNVMWLVLGSSILGFILHLF